MSKLTVNPDGGLPGRHGVVLLRAALLLRGGQQLLALSARSSPPLLAAELRVQTVARRSPVAGELVGIQNVQNRERSGSVTRWSGGAY